MPGTVSGLLLMNDLSAQDRLRFAKHIIFAPTMMGIASAFAR